MDLANASFVAADTPMFAGPLGLVIEAGPGPSATLFVRLLHSDRRWVESAIGTNPSLIDDAALTLPPSTDRWQSLIRGDVDPISAIIHDKIKIRAPSPVTSAWDTTVA